MTDDERKKIVDEVRHELQDELAIYIGNGILRYLAKVVGLGALALCYYLISHGYLKI